MVVVSDTALNDLKEGEGNNAGPGEKEQLASFCLSCV